MNECLEEVIEGLVTATVAFVVYRVKEADGFFLIPGYFEFDMLV